MKETVPIKDKINLTIEEASAYSGIGVNRIRSLLKEPGCRFVLYVGNRQLVKREEFEKFCKSSYSI